MSASSQEPDTIFALSSGQPPSGVAVIRISGPAVRFVIETVSGAVPQPRFAKLRQFRRPAGEVVDQGLLIWFPAPASFTGEDCAEFHLHGSRAVVSAMVEVFAGFDDVRVAQPGEFSKRAFENGKLDLAEVEGLADLISAETETQRRSALGQLSGGLSAVVEDWRYRLNHIRAMVEANLDFVEEEDIPGDVSARALGELDAIAREISGFLNDGRHGEIIRDGLEVVLLGKPNVGKSSLLNALAKRDVAIVTEEAGTTRDLLEVHLDIGGYAVTLVDTAGLRDTESIVERKGIERARRRAQHADLLVLLSESPDEDNATLAGDLKPAGSGEVPYRRFISKDDSGQFGADGISVVRVGGLEPLLDWLRNELRRLGGAGEPGLITRQRHREALRDCLNHIETARDGGAPAEVTAEHLRDAAMALGRITGRVDVEQLLDAIFSEFCVGK